MSGRKRIFSSPPPFPTFLAHQLDPVGDEKGPRRTAATHQQLPEGELVADDGGGLEHDVCVRGQTLAGPHVAGEGGREP